MTLAQQTCRPCEDKEDRLDADRVQKLLAEVPEWRHENQPTDRIQRTFQFKDFKRTIGFVNMVAALAESEGHHPDLHVSYGEVEVVLWTHAVDGLSDNDFILAAKIDRMAG